MICRNWQEFKQESKSGAGGVMLGHREFKLRAHLDRFGRLAHGPKGNIPEVTFLSILPDPASYRLFPHRALMVPFAHVETATRLPTEFAHWSR
jgi:hypothetical protein